MFLHVVLVWLFWDHSADQVGLEVTELHLPLPLSSLLGIKPCATNAHFNIYYEKKLGHQIQAAGKHMECGIVPKVQRAPQVLRTFRQFSLLCDVMKG